MLPAWRAAPRANSRDSLKSLSNFINNLSRLLVPIFLGHAERSRRFVHLRVSSSYDWPFPVEGDDLAMSGRALAVKRVSANRTASRRPHPRSTILAWCVHLYTAIG